MSIPIEECFEEPPRNRRQTLKNAAEDTLSMEKTNLEQKIRHYEIDLADAKQNLARIEGKLELLAEQKAAKHANLPDLPDVPTENLLLRVHKHWTHDEVEKLLYLEGKMKIVDIAKILSRQEKNIESTLSWIKTPNGQEWLKKFRATKTPTP